MEDTDNHSKAVVTFLAVVIIATIVVAAIVASPKRNALATASNPSTAAEGNGSASGGSGSADDTSFKDGTYTATGSYESPGGNESITVHVTLKNSIITATSADSGAQDPEAGEYQSMFISGYKSLVVGKNIADVSLSRVSGSSLTSQGFNDAIQHIENQAKA